MQAKTNAKPVLTDLPLATVHELIEPGPVVLLTTAQAGRANVMTMSWHMMVEFEPPLIACVVSAGNYSFEALRKTKQCVIAIPALNLAPVVVKIGNCSGRDVDKFAAFRLATCTAKHVSPPLIADCFANLECKIVDTGFVKKYNLFIVEVVKGWANAAQRTPKTIHHHGYGRFSVDGKFIKLASRMR